MLVRTIERSFSVHVYDKKALVLPECEQNEYSPNYIASCMVFLYGDRGMAHLITGAGFYQAAEQIFVACEKKGVRVLEGYVTKEHARLLRAACRKFADVGITHGGFVAGIEMVWVTVKRKLSITGE